MKIYTKTGDKGTSSIASLRLVKHHIYFKTFGSIDILNSNLGTLIYQLKDSLNYKDIYSLLHNIQSNLMLISSYLGGYLDINLQQDIVNLENIIDKLEDQNTPLKNFILPQGSLESVMCHNIRALVRMAERDLSELSINNDFLAIVGNKNTMMIESVMPYINRLSDCFFVLARYFNNKGQNDIIWKV